MLTRPSFRTAATTLAAAAVLVGGANLASYAATGNPLILGHSNAAGGTTALKNTGRGPALSLNNIKSAPPLVVNSSKMVKNLNANMVGGKTVGQLASKTLRFHIGSVGQDFVGGDVQVFSAKVPTGTYEIGMTGLLLHTGGTSDSYSCLILDKNALQAAVGGGSLDYTKLYGLDGASQGEFRFGIINYTNPAQKVSRSSIALGCTFSGTGTYTVGRQVAFTFHRVTASDKRHGAAIPLAKSAARGLSLPR